MVNPVTFLCGNISLLVFGANTLQPIVHIPIRIRGYELSPFSDIIITNGFVARFFRKNRKSKMQVGMHQLGCALIGRLGMNIFRGNESTIST